MSSKYISFLENDEQVIWSGKPVAKNWFAYGDTVYVPYSIFLGGFLLYCESLIWTFRAPMGIQLLGVLLTLIAAYLIVGRLLFRRYKMKHSVYLVTNLRVIEWFDSEWIKPKFVTLEAFDKMVKYIEKDGSGILLFGEYHPAILIRVNNGMEPFKIKINKIVGFYYIEGVQEVFDIIKALQKKEGPKV